MSAGGFFRLRRAEIWHRQLMAEPRLLDLKRCIHAKDGFTPLRYQHPTRRKRTTVSGALDANDRRDERVARAQKYPCRECTKR